METPKHLPSELAELLQNTARLPAIPEVVDCVTCLATDPPEGAVISRPIIEACKGLGRKKIVRALEALEEVEVIERYTPDPATSHRIKQPGRTACFKLTKLGGEVLPRTPPAQCDLRDPLTAHTPEQKLFVDCARYSAKLLLPESTESTDEAGASNSLPAADENQAEPQDGASDKDEPPELDDYTEIHRHRDDPAAVERLVTSEKALAIFEKRRGHLTSLAKRILSSKGYDPLLAEDVVSEASIYVYERFVKRGDTMDKSHFEATLIILVRTRTIDMMRKEALIENAQQKAQFGFRVRSERYDQTDSIVEKEALSGIGSDRLITLIAQMLLSMGAKRYEMLFDQYRKEVGKDIHSDAPPGTLKSRLYYGRKKAFEHVAVHLLSKDETQADGEGEKELTAREAIQVILSESEAPDPSPAEPTASPPELAAMKDRIKALLLPTESNK